MTKAESLAKHILDIGDMPNSKCHRIQFMGGSYPDLEKSQGGLNEPALAKVIQKWFDNQISSGQNDYQYENAEEQTGYD